MLIKNVPKCQSHNRTQKEKKYDYFQERCFEEKNGIDRLSYVIGLDENCTKSLLEGVGDISNRYKENQANENELPNY